jgi:hypothetical protein
MVEINRRFQARKFLYPISGYLSNQNFKFGNLRNGSLFDGGSVGMFILANCALIVYRNHAVLARFMALSLCFGLTNKPV